MEEILNVPLKRVRLNPYWIALPLLALVFFVYRAESDPLRIFALVLSIALFPLLIEYRLLLVCLTFFFFLGAFSDIINVALNFRWIFLGICVVVAATYPILSKEKVKQNWKESRWLWFFCALAAVSVVYSIVPRLTMMRAFSVICLFFVTSRLIKPMAATYGPGRIVDMILYALVPFYLYSVFLIGSAHGYNISETTFQTLQEKNLDQGMGMVNSQSEFSRFHGIFGNPNTMGLTIALFFPLVLAKLLSGSAPDFGRALGARSQSSKYPIRKSSTSNFDSLASSKKNGLLAVMSLLMIVFLFMSGSRTAIASTLLSSVYILFRFFGGKGGRWIGGMILTLLLAAGFIWMKSGTGGLLSYFRFDERNLLLAGGRVEAWLIGRNFIVQRPWLGWGFGSEDQLFLRTGYQFLFHEGNYFHNAYLGLIAQLGIIGACLLFIPLFFLLFKEIAAKNPSILRLGLQGMLISGLIACFFESWIYSAGNGEALPFWSGIAVLEFLRDTENGKPELSSARADV